MGEKAARVALALLAAASMTACGGGDDEEALPNVVGERLDVAKASLGDAGVDDGDVDVVGGGAFGVVDESNWTVCSQDPDPGGVASKVRVVIDRSCESAGSAPSSDKATATSSAPETVAPPTTTAAPPSRSGGGASTSGVVPDVVGLDLQHAQDTAQAAGFYALSSEDALGASRNQVLDRNWKVCSQDPPGGTAASTSTEITFFVVKLEEACP